MQNSSFHDYSLSKEILRALDTIGYESPTRVQKEVMPLGLQSKDLIVKSQTGSGKTASFGIPICEKIELEIREPQALILTPTRELCVQVKESITDIGRFKRIRCAAIFGKQPFDLQTRELKQRVHVVSGTPGRTLDHIQRGTLTVQNIRYLIIDEADKMLNMGFIEQVEAVINSLPRERVTMLFSATMPDEIENLCHEYMSNPVRIEIAPENTSKHNIEAVYYSTADKDKYNLLKKTIFVENPDSCIIFCNTRENVERLLKQMKKDDFSCNALHGGMLQNDRLNIMKDFKEGNFRFLIATDVAARGIDIENLSIIINYDVPMENEAYVHRIGRTGRAGNTGKAVTFVSPQEMRYLQEIEGYIGYEIAQATPPSDSEAKDAKEHFKTSHKVNLKPKISMNSKLNSEITKLYINAGKKKKIRAGDLVGTISNIEGVSSEDIGIIDIHDNHSYIDILDGKGDYVMEALQNKTIKGKTLRVEKAVK